MEKVKQENKVENHFSFHSISSPRDFVQRVMENGVMKCERTEKGFRLHVDSNHGGEVVYDCEVKRDENGGSFIDGELVSIPWNSRKKEEAEESIFQKVWTILGFILLIPVFLIFLIVWGFFELYYLLAKKKEQSVPDSKKLTDFMTQKMCCRQVENTALEAGTSIAKEF